MIPSLASFTLPNSALPGETAPLAPAVGTPQPLVSGFMLAGLNAPATPLPAPQLSEDAAPPESSDPEQLLQLLLDPSLTTPIAPPQPPIVAPHEFIAAQLPAGVLPAPKPAAAPMTAQPTPPQTLAGQVVAVNDNAPLQPLKLRTPQDAREASKQVVALMQTQLDEPLAKVLPTPIAVSAQASNPAIAQATVKHLPPLALPEAPQEKAAALREALGDRLQMQVEQRSQKATIRLDPPNLGKLDISLHYEGGKLQVQIQAAQPDVYRALQQVSQELRGALSEQNNVAVNVQISQQQGDQRQAPRQQHTQDAVLSNNTFDEVTEEQRHRDQSILTTV